MNQDTNQPLPLTYRSIQASTVASGFSMASDIMTCTLLRSLAASKPGGKFLELGTGTGLATSWILDGMDTHSTLVSIDNDRSLLEIARSFLGDDERLELVATDGGDWISSNKNTRFDYIFADTWHGKYLMLDEVLNMVNAGGFYIIDDMIRQPNWPEGHQEKAISLLHYLDERQDFFITKQSWATGLVIAVKKSK